MFKDNEAAPTPDPAIGQAALKQAQLGEQWMSFAKDAYAVSQVRQAELDSLTKEVTQKQIGLADEAASNARKDRQRYESVFLPAEDAFIDKARNYGSAEHQAEAAAEAGAEIQTQAGMARQAAERRNAAMGVAPDSGRAATLDRQSEIATALGTADAQNRARQGVRDKGLALEADIVNLGRGLPAQASAGASQSAALGSNAVGLTGQGNDAYARTTNIMGTGFDAASRGYGNQANILNNLHNSEMDTWRANRDAQNQEMAGWGSLIGTGLGLLLPSDEEIKEDKTPVPEGEALNAVRNMPVEEWSYKPGVEDGGRHVGTYAQDFKAQTGKGDGKTIPVVDAIGVTMKAVQDLAAQVDRLSEAMGFGDAPARKKPGAKIVEANDNTLGLGDTAEPPYYQSA